MSLCAECELGHLHICRVCIGISPHMQSVNWDVAKCTKCELGCFPIAECELGISLYVQSVNLAHSLL